jgi:DNA end-binding protein Ku
VKLYSVVDEKSIRFHLLHDQDEVRLKQRLVNPETDETVDYNEAEKAFEVDRGVFVKLSKDELESLEPDPSREIRVLRFIPTEEVGLQWYARPYMLGPDGDTEEYFALAAALTLQKKVGICKWVMRGNTYVGALAAEGDYLALNTLRFRDDVIPEDRLEPPAGRPISRKEKELAEQLIGVLEEEFEPDEYHDEYRARVMELIEAKRKGRKLPVRRASRKPKTASLTESLLESLKRAKQAQA